MNKIQLTQLAISVSTGIFLLGKGMADFLFEQIIELGESSQEILRSDRLPLLPLDSPSSIDT